MINECYSLFLLRECTVALFGRPLTVGAPRDCGVCGGALTATGGYCSLEVCITYTLRGGGLVHNIYHFPSNTRYTTGQVRFGWGPKSLRGPTFAVQENLASAFAKIEKIGQ